MAMRSMSFYCEHEEALYYEQSLKDMFYGEALKIGRLTKHSELIGFKPHTQIVVWYKTPSNNIRKRLRAYWYELEANLNRLRS